MDVQIKIITKTGGKLEVRPAGESFTIKWLEDGEYRIGTYPDNDIVIP